MRTTIDGISYEATDMGPAASGGTVYALSPIGKRGKPLAQHRPGVLRDGVWKLSPYVR